MQNLSESEKVLIEILLKEIKSVVTEIYEFEYRVKSRLGAFWILWTIKQSIRGTNEKTLKWMV